MPRVREDRAPGGGLPAEEGGGHQEEGEQGDQGEGGAGEAGAAAEGQGETR